jgi:5-dehydro-2-deoxygluconokinase
MQQLWQRMALNRFVVLGRVGMDLYADPPGTRIEEADRFTAAIGGSAGNIAVALARQGAEARLVARVSQDAVGRYCIAELKRYGVDCRHVTPLGGEARNSLAITETRAKDCQVVLYRNGAADLGLTKSDVEEIDFAGVSALVVTGTALASEPSRAATQRAIERAKAAGALTVLDVDYRAYSWPSQQEAADVCLRAARTCDITIGNDSEFALLAADAKDGQALAQELARAGLFAVYKMGEKGSVTFTADTRFVTPIFPVNALKPMGAGDGFMGGLLAGLAQGAALQDAVARGAATAAMIVAGIGCAPASPDRAALDRFMTDNRPTGA